MSAEPKAGLSDDLRENSTRKRKRSIQRLPFDVRDSGRIVGYSYKDSGRPAEPAIAGLLSKRRSIKCRVGVAQTTLFGTATGTSLATSDNPVLSELLRAINAHSGILQDIRRLASTMESDRFPSERLDGGFGKARSFMHVDGAP